MLENLVTGFPDELWFEFVKFRQLLKPQFMVKVILMRAGEKAQNTKCLWHRMRTWVHLQGTHIKSRVQQYVFLPSAWGWQWQGRMLGCCRPVHLAKSWHFRLNNRPSPQNIRCRVTHWYQSGFHTHTPTCSWARTSTHRCQSYWEWFHFQSPTSYAYAWPYFWERIYYTDVSLRLNVVLLAFYIFSIWINSFVVFSLQKAI